MWRSWKLCAVLVPILLFIGVGSYIYSHSAAGIDINNPPQFIQHEFVDLSKIYSISKFRSGAGHDFSGKDETCRSMKHYFYPQYDPNAEYKKDGEGKTLPPAPDGKSDIPIYSPVDGEIQSISEERTPIGKQIGIVPSAQSRFLIRLFHVYPLDGIEVGSRVVAGQKIGVIGGSQGTDIAIQGGALPWEENFISYFSVMPDSVFAAYQDRGVKTRDEVIISKEYRDAHPLQCKGNEGEEFDHPADYDQAQDEVHLSGYIDPQFSEQEGEEAAVATSDASASTSTSTSTNTPATSSAATPAEDKTLDLSHSNNGDTVELAVGQKLILTANNGNSALDVMANSDTSTLSQISNNESYQFSRTFKALKDGQVSITLTLTPKCALPSSSPQCKMPSSMVTLNVVIK